MIIENVQEKIVEQQTKLSCAVLEEYRDKRLLRLLMIVFVEVAIGTICVLYMFDHVYFSVFLIIPLLLIVLLKHKVLKKHKETIESIQDRLDGYTVYESIDAGESRYKSEWI